MLTPTTRAAALPASLAPTCDICLAPKPSPIPLDAWRS